MPSNISELISGELPDPVKREVLLAFDSMPTDAFCDELLRLGQRFEGEALGYLLYPLLRSRLERETNAIEVALATISDSRATPDYQLVMLDLLDKAVRNKRTNTLWDFYVDSLLDIVEQPSIHEKVKAKAIRCLARTDPTRTGACLKRIIDTGNQILVNAAAHVISTWLRKNRPFDEGLLSGLVTFARANQEAALYSPSVMRALAIANRDETTHTLHELVAAIPNNEQRDVILAAIGTLMRPDLLLSQLQQLFENPTEEGLLALKGIISERPGLLRMLADTDHLQELVSCLQLSPYTASAADYSYVRRRFEAYPMMKTAGWIEATVHKPGVALPKLPLQIAKAIEEASEDPKTEYIVTRQGYSTGFQLGDALYKWLSPAHCILGNHWHAGLFAGFHQSILSSVYVFQGIHVNSFWDAVESFSATEVINSVDIDLAQSLKTMSQNFLSKFGIEKGVPFEGARTAKNIPVITRHKIVDMAAAMIGKDIWWTWTDQLDYCHWDWDGTIDDIDELRCDGLVEYVYEKNGIRVCGGSDPEKWNISHPGTSWPENHNDFHGYGCNPDDYKRGELCPRIQAGNIGNDSSFFMPRKRKPEISDFKVIASRFGCWITFAVDAPYSRDIYARLLIQKEGVRDRYFLKSVSSHEQYSGSGELFEGTWCLKKIDLQTCSSRVSTIWTGATVATPETKITWPFVNQVIKPENPGPNYTGVPGTYKFMLQCIDEGGNVSDEWTCIKEIRWR
ncbi:MAG: hypothetical protein IAE79_13445 [Anaerolinea sp.]|nr:hypothetical protein [Anaerolinea sp.]